MRMTDALRVELHIAKDIIRYAYFIISIGKCSLMLWRLVDSNSIAPNRGVARYASIFRLSSV